LDRDGTINIDVDKLGLFTNYTKLNLAGQNLTTLQSLEGLTKLTELNLNSNKITNIKAINNLTNLKILYLKGTENNINLVEIEDIISNLDNLQVSTESLKTIVNCNVDKITKLVLNNSDLAEIPDLSKFTKLTNLELKGNNITDFSTISNIESLQILNLSQTNLHGRMINFSKLTNLKELNLSGNMLWTADLTNLQALKNNTNLTINLSNNSIIDASSLLVLDTSCKIDLRNNVNLSQKSKDDLKERFGNNVTF